MNNKLNTNINSIYNNDVKNIYNTINNYIPKLDNWYLNQSIMFEDDKKIIFKAIEKEQEKIGNQISIIFDDNNKIILTNLNNKISILKNYVENNNSIFEYISITQKDNYLYRNLIYSINNNEYNYCEKYNIDTNNSTSMCNDFNKYDTYSSTLEDILEDFKKNYNSFTRTRE